MSAAGLTVLAVPWDPTNSTAPHTTYPFKATTEVPIVLGATVPAGVTSGDQVAVKWQFGDRSPDRQFYLSNIYDISIVHQYPASAAVGTKWTATVTVIDITQHTSGGAHYYVVQQANNLTSRVNVAIDKGLWYLHQTMWRNSTVVNGRTVPWGGWDTQTYACPTVGGLAYACAYPGAINATNVRAFEFHGHQASGPATDPYTDDVARGLARMFSSLAATANFTNSYQYNPATVNYGCSDGSQVQPDGTCVAPATKVFYNPGATSCTAPPCTFTFDGNNDGSMIYSNDGSGEPVYTGGFFIEALASGGTPAAVAPTGPAGVLGLTYQNIVQNMVDWYDACQYEYDVDPGNQPAYNGYQRGGNYSASGGAWLYNCQQGDDNSASHSAAGGLISASRGFFIQVPQVIKDMNNVWVTNSQDVTDVRPIGPNPFAGGDDYGAYGYRGSFAYSNAWGPFAVTPSAMVQMAMDGIGRTMNTIFGDPTTDPDQRWNNAETFYADNFCNDPSSGAYYSPRAYTYGLYSFTQAMLQHDPGGSLAPIQYLRTLTPGVFAGGSAPPNSIDWYAALSPAKGGTDRCDGVAQTLIGYQSADGHWYGNDYDQGYQENQSPFETAWSLEMLYETEVLFCISDLHGKGIPSGTDPAKVLLTWSPWADASSYAVFRSSQTGGPYSYVGGARSAAFLDSGGLKNGSTYYYVVQPVEGTAPICQSNQATVTIPN